MKLIIPLAALMLGACAPQSYVATVEPVCGSLKTVYITKDDVLVEQTASDLEHNNIALGTLCGNTRPPKRKTTTTKGATS